MAKVAGCAYVATVVPNNPRRVESVIKKAVLIAREVGSTYIQAYTSCNIEYAIPTDKVMEDAKNVEKRSVSVHGVHQRRSEAVSD